VKLRNRILKILPSGRFSKKTIKLLTKFPRLVTLGRHNSAMITDRRKFTTKLTLYGMSSFRFYRQNQFKVFPLDFTLRTENVLTQIFRNDRCPILRIKTNSTPHCWCCLATDIWKKSRLNWKLKISNAVDNADVIQSQARDTRHRRMQGVNSLCTDSGPLQANTVLCHSTQYSLLVCLFSHHGKGHKPLICR